MNKHKIAGMIISAGLSSRMGGFKPLIKIDGKSFLEHIITKLTNICETIYIVTGHQSDIVKQHIVSGLEDDSQDITTKIKWVHNPHYKKGMLTSLQTGLRTLDKCDWLLYHFVDQPTIPEAFYSQFISQINDKSDWIQPTCQSQHGHPILFSKNIFKAILDLNEKESLRHLSKHRTIKKTFWDCIYNQILQDFDTPDQLEKLTI